MKAYMQCHLVNTARNLATQNAIVYYMSGVAPTTPSQVKALVDLSSPSDLHEKCVGTSLTKVTYSYDTTGKGKVKGSYKRYGSNVWLKGGSLLVATGAASRWFMLPPDKVYYSDGRRVGIDNMHPALFTMPINCITNSLTIPNNQGVLLRSDATANVSFGSFYVDYVFEYQSAVSVSGFRFCNGYTNGMSDYVDFWYRTDLYYYNTSTSAYVLASSYSTDLSTGYNGVWTNTFTAVSSTKFLIRIYPEYARAGYYSNFLNGFALLTPEASLPSARSISDITWSVTVPFPNSTYIYGSSMYVMANRYDSTKFDDLATTYPRTAFDLTSNPAQGRSSFVYGNKTKMMPAIIDTCGLNGNMYISKSTGLTSADAPILVAYEYNAGEMI